MCECLSAQGIDVFIGPLPMGLSIVDKYERVRASANEGASVISVNSVANKIHKLRPRLTGDSIKMTLKYTLTRTHIRSARLVCSNVSLELDRNKSARTEHEALLY